MDRKIRTYSNLAQPVSHQGGDIEKLISRPGVIHVNPRSVETCSSIYNCRMGGLSSKPYLWNVGSFAIPFHN